MLKARIDQDLKTALLAGDKVLATTLRSLKSVILYAEVATGSRNTGLNDDEIVAPLAKEAKKRQESADLYKQGGNEERSTLELAEKKTIESYLPSQLSDEELAKAIDEVISEQSVAGRGNIGQVIGAVKQKVGGQAEGGRIAQLVKERLVNS